MTFDFMSVKTVSSSSLRAEKETKKKIEQEKTQALEQVRYLKYFNFLICLNKSIRIYTNVVLLVKYSFLWYLIKMSGNKYET